MSSRRVRATVVLGSLVGLLLGLAGPAHAAPSPAPAPTPAATSTPLPEGPWPPDEILARPPGGVAPRALAAAGPSTTCPAAPFGVQRTAPGSGKTVALTFDDGPGVTTPAILSILQRYGIPATFFNIGVNASVRPAYVRSELVTGMVIGNHSWDHPQLPTLSASGQASEMDRATAEQSALTAVGSCLFRPPYGEFNATTLSLAQQRRMAVWNWSVDTEDWKAGTSTSSTWVERIYSRAVAGGSQAHPVILMHNPPAGVPATVTALPRIIDYYRAHGYRFVDLAGGTGQRASTPAAATTAAGLHVLIRNAAGNVIERTLRGSTWIGWSQLGGSVVGGPAAAATSSAGLAAVAIGSDNAVYRETVSDGGARSGWSSLSGVTTTRPGSGVAPDGVENIVIRGANGQGYLRQRTTAGWGVWIPLGGLLAPYAPSVAATAGGVLTVACLGANHAMYVKTRSGGAWSGWRLLGGSINSDVALSPTADGTKVVAVVRGGQNGYYSVLDPDGTGWTGWLSLGGSLASGPAVTRNGAALEVFVVGGDGRIYRRTATNGTAVTGWGGWRALP
ncbi:MAG TPA: polysaccharide deacetylase family protein [Mycobacteriales bacterium]|jgi:peptidoglycan/xylan/chitin deacetylase (PgdA/CDA1 family)